jgi:starch synthase
MRILFVTPEVTPYSGATPAGDACWALPKALKARGHEVTILSPLYGFVDPTARSLARRLRKVQVTLGEEKIAFEVYDARTAAGVDLLFLGQEQLFRPCKVLPTGDDPEDGLRYGAFCKAAIEVLRADEPGYDVLHCHDWGTALAPVLVSLEELDVPTVMTVHDVRQQGVFPADLITRLGLPRSLFSIDGLEFYGKTNLLKGGVLEADRVTTVSATYAREIYEEGGASGLEGVFRERKKELTGITGGVDIAVWNPATDANLEARFDPMDRTGKARSKSGLQRDLELPIRDDVPLVGVIGALHPSSGLDVLARIVTRVLRNDVQVVVVSDQEPNDEALVAVLAEHASRFPDRLKVRTQAPAALVHRVLAASDCLLVPPRQAPGGSLQMRAQRYGALPIGLAAGAIADTIVDCDAKLTTGTGFTFTSAHDDAVLAAVQRATAAFASRPAFEKARARAMRADHSWERSAYLYERLYEAL